MEKDSKLVRFKEMNGANYAVSSVDITRTKEVLFSLLFIRSNALNNVSFVIK